ncbi:Uncharacterised protein [uncultured Ruminococcus sp.]|nr:Uncharacterised protein [uncultured Ruminococcus sp.]
MLDLTFGEQVKIILSRKGMTIKELAETIEERTGKKMSRQNLTQRLGRDNFQEQDMRMIADILGCPFQLSILADSEAAERAANVEDVVPTEKELHKLAKTKARKEKKAREAEQLHAAMEQIPSEVTDMSGASEKEMTLGDYMDIHEELVRRETGEIPIVNETIEEPVTEESVSVMEEISDEPALMEAEPVEEVPEAVETVYEETHEEIPEAPRYEEIHEEVQQEIPEEVHEEAYVEEKKEETHHEKKLTGWRAMFQRRNKKERQEEKHEEEKIEREIEEATEPLEAMEEDSDFIEYEEPVQPEQTYYEEQQPAQEEEIAQAVYAEEEDDDAEDLERGELNPYTGHEYESNSVRMHPKRIGYVQVYDRRDHAWTDMTEWAFLGYQERKKALLGKDYEEPIYLD